MKKQTLLLFILLSAILVLPVYAANTVQVQREIKQKDFKTLKENPTVMTTNQYTPEDNLQLMKNKSKQYAQYRLSIPKSKAYLINEKDFCDVSFYIKTLGGEKPIATFMNLKNMGKSIYKIGNTTYNNINYCIKIEFNYLGKHYEEGSCK